MTDYMKENEISYDIRGAAFTVHNKLGPGLLESVYEHAMMFELRKMGHTVQNQVGIPFEYEGTSFEIGFRMDVLVDNFVVVEIKSVEKLADVHFKQGLTYLRLSKKKLGLLINFNSSSLKDNIIRVIN
jgi:GxxExxY protein